MQTFLPSWDETSFAGFAPRYNIAPTQSVLGIVQPEAGQPRAVSQFRWGLIPPWSDDLSIGSRMINARSETVAEKPSFRKSFAERRCLVVADGYYEWQTTQSGKQPFLIERPDRGVFAFAGIWEENRKASKTGETLVTCSLMTVAANDFLASIHDRMPVILSEHQFDKWLDPSFRDTALLQSWLTPLDNNSLNATPVSKHVGNVRNSDAACAEPVGETQSWR